MKTWVMADTVPDIVKGYLTAGKWYEVSLALPNAVGGGIISDKGLEYILFRKCAYLNGGDWNVYHGDTPPDAKPSINQQLLEALEEMCDMWKTVCSVSGWDEHHMAQYDKAQAAIAAAKGEI